MARSIFFITLLLALTIPPGVAAQSSETPDWDESVKGIGERLLQGQGLGFLIATPSDTVHSKAVASLIREHLLESGIADVVMDDSMLGSLAGLSDEQIIEKADEYPVDIVMVLRTFPGASGPTVVLRIETIGKQARTFRLRPGEPTTWEQKRATADLQDSKTGEPDASLQPDEPERPTEIARRASGWADYVRGRAVTRAETVRLVQAERARRLLTFEPRGGFGRVVDVDEEQVQWPVVYQRIGGDELEQAWRTRKTVRTAAFVSGGILSAAGFGLLFVSLTNAANCTPQNREMCASPAMTGLGALSLSVGAISVFTGLLVSPHPVSADTLDERIDRYNRQLSVRK